jgi:hypothetical protein
VAKIVEVPGVGDVEFSEDMSDEEISAQIVRSMREQAAIAKAPDPETARRLGEIAQIEDPEARRRASLALGIENSPFPFRQILRAGQEMEKAVRDPRKYILEGVDPKTGKPNIVQSTLRGAVQGVTLGFGDELAAAIEPGEYARNRDVFRAKNLAAREANPGMYLAGTLGGALAAPLPGGPAGQALTRGARVLRGAGQGSIAGGLYGAGGAEGGPLETVTEAGKGTILGGVLGGGLSAAGQALGQAATRLPAALRRFAGQRNLKAAGGIQSDLARARKQVGREGLEGIGYEMGGQGLVGPTSTPASTFERATEILDRSGKEMGALTQAADKAIGTSSKTAPRLGQVVERARREILEPLAADPHQAQAAEQFSGLLDRMSAGEKTPGWTVLPISKLHEMRQQADRALYGLRGTQDPFASAYRDALHDFRSLLSDEINSTMERTGLGSAAWKAANRRYEVASRAQELSERGMDRWQGNNLFTPYEMLALLGGAGAAGAHSGSFGEAGLAGAGALLSTRLAQRHGSGTLGWLGRQGAEITAPLSSPAGRAAMTSGAELASEIGPRELMALGLIPSADEAQDEQLRRAAATIEAIRRRSEGKTNAP